jgi:hypothetical protein
MIRDATPRGVLAHWIEKYPNIDTHKLWRIFLTEIEDKKELKEAVAAEVFARALEDVTRGLRQNH